MSERAAMKTPVNMKHQGLRDNSSRQREWRCTGTRWRFAEVEPGATRPVCCGIRFPTVRDWTTGRNRLLEQGPWVRCWQRCGLPGGEGLAGERLPFEVPCSRVPPPTSPPLRLGEGVSRSPQYMTPPPLARGQAPLGSDHPSPP